MLYQIEKHRDKKYSIKHEHKGISCCLYGVFSSLMKEV